MMVQKGKIKIGGLQNKIFNLCLMLVIGVMIIFAILGVFRLRQLSETANATSQRQTEEIKRISERSMKDEVEGRVNQVARLNAELMDGEFWTMSHDQKVFALQVEEIIRNANNYTPAPLNLPDAANEGKYTLQLLVPEGRSPEADKEEMDLIGKVATLAPMMKEIVEANEQHLIECMVSFPSGYSIIMDAHSEQKFESDGSLTPYNATKRPWYSACVELKDVYFSPVEFSYFDVAPEMQFARPVFVDGKLVAVVEGALRLNNLENMARNVELSEKSITMLISGEGDIVFCSKDTSNWDLGGTSAISTFIKSASRGLNGNGLVTVDGTEYYASYSSMGTVGWSYAILYPKSEIEKSTDQILNKMDSISAEANEKYESILDQTKGLVILVVILLIANAIVVALAFSHRILKPISVMTDKIKNLSDDNLQFEMEDVYKTGDEIELLAGAFSELSGKTVQYIKKVMEVTAEKERIGAELDLANRIQADMLPKDFPLFPDRNEFSLYASMTPAKEVGGDLYDSFLLDEDHLAMVIGDVSGKGVPAALFMVISKTLLKTRAMQGGTPAEILYDVNNSLCDGNSSSLFVTVWIGILTISTGHVIESNAGHEHPAVYRAAEDKFELIKRKHFIALGSMEGIPYKDDEFDIEDGDMIFVYTDGVPEAQNSADELFNTDRMLEALNRHRKDEPEELLDHIHEDVNEFVGDAPQFDDLTMLAMKYARCEKETR